MRWRERKYYKKMMENKYPAVMPEPEEVQVVVLMGGLGTRLGERTKCCPKSLTDIEGRAFFDYQLDLLQTYGFHKFLFLVGYHANVIEEYYRDGSQRGICIKYSYDGKELLGTGGAVRNAYDLLEEDFLLIYGDSYMDIDYRETIYRYFRSKAEGSKALMTVMENHNCLDKSNVIFEDGKILSYDKQHQDTRMHYIDYGVEMFERSLFQNYEKGSAFDIALLQKRLADENRLAAHEVTKRFYEIGSPDSLEEFRRYVSERFGRERPAIFLDRDGVVNQIVFCEETEQLDSPLHKEELVLENGAVEAMRFMQEAGYYLFIVTNQPAAAKGKVLLEELYDVNTELCRRLHRQGIDIDAVEICPHHPEGSEKAGERFLIKKCNCRKPAAGMLEAVCRRFRVDRAGSWMAGDSFTDVLAGISAGVRTVFLGDYKCDVCKCLQYRKPDLICKDLIEFTECLREEKRNGNE